MFKFESDQKVLEIGNIHLGGQPGEYPTALMAAIFYAGDKLVAGVNSPEFDRAKATSVIESATKKCREVGVPLVLDVICATPEQSRAFIGFALEVSEAPVLMDGTNSEVCLAGLETAKEMGQLDRLIYNSVLETSKDEELKKAVDLGCKNAFVMLVNQRNPTAKGKIAMARDLIPRAYSLGFENLILDLAVLDIIEVGTCAAALRDLKEEFGLPSGCSPTHTHRDRWKKAGLFSSKEQAAAKVSCATMLQMAGADYFIYDIKQTEVIPAMAMVDAEIAYGAKNWRIRPKSDTHPLYNVF
jgi:tetrahydromethanopterin S-methyltransferase subunit H